MKKAINLLTIVALTIVALSLSAAPALATDEYNWADPADLELLRGYYGQNLDTDYFYHIEEREVRVIFYDRDAYAWRVSFNDSDNPFYVQSVEAFQKAGGEIIKISGQKKVWARTIGEVK